MNKRHLETSIFGEPEQNPAGPGGADGTGQPPTRRADPRRKTRRRRGRGRRQLLVLVVALVLVVGAGLAAVLVLRTMFAGLTESNDYVGAGSGAISVVVHSGDAGRTIGATLEKAGVVKTAKAFSDAAADDPRAASIQPGSYTLHARMSSVAALAILINPANRTVPRVTIREGLWVSETIKALSNGTGRPLAEYTAALKSPTTLGLPAAAKGNAEGYLFPATYEFETKATASEQLSTMVAKSLQELRKLGVSSDRMQRVLTVASIVEAEASVSADRPKIARVIENRLAKHMRLQLDTTVSFISGRRGKITTTNVERASRSPYNTYLVAGLPPGPIGSPGLAAINAAVHPSAGSWLYFVAVNPDTGETRFSVDKAGHDASVKLFQKWCSDHPGTC